MAAEGSVGPNSMFENVDERFLPEPDHRPTLSFGAPWITYVRQRPSLNAAEQILDSTVRRLGPDRTAIHDVTSGEAWSYGRLQAVVNRLGNGLLSLGLRPGERVVLRLPEVPEAAAAQLAVWKVGGIAAVTSVLERARELTFLLNDTEAGMLIVHGDYLEEVEKVRAECPHLRVVIVVGTAGPDYVQMAALVADASERLEPFPSHPLDGASIFYTGGTTGHPKGCLHTHAGEVVLSDLNNLAVAAGPDDVFFTHAPIGHAAGNSEKVNYPLRVGGSVIYAVRPTPGQVWELAERYRATIFLGAATMFRMMLREVPSPREAFPGLALRLAMSSAEVLDQRTFEAWRGKIGFEIDNVVGMVPFRHIFLHPRWNGVRVAPGLSVGAPLPSYDAKLVDPETLRPVLEAGEAGRMALRGPTGITYWTNLNPTIREKAASDVRDGWSIGDDAYHFDDSGWFWFDTRLDDMIVTGGRQIAGVEVETVLKQHDAVSEAAVVGAPDELRGSIVMAYVVLSPGHEPGPEIVEELQNFSKAEMAPYKYPRRIEFVEALPKDEYGKLQRRLLRERARHEASEIVP